MSRTNSQAKVVSKEQLVPRANRFVIKKNNQRVASDSHITDTMLRFVVEILRHHKLYNLFGMEVPDAMISDAIKKKAGRATRISNQKWKRKRFMCYVDQVANVPNKLKKDDVPRKTRSLTIAEEAVVGELVNSISIQEPRSQRRQKSQLTIDSQSDKAVADMYNE
ncbi:hypothetical protein Tco_0798840 [Tanacetum coccineum]